MIAIVLVAALLSQAPKPNPNIVLASSITLTGAGKAAGGSGPVCTAGTLDFSCAANSYWLGVVR